MSFLEAQKAIQDSFPCLNARTPGLGLAVIVEGELWHERYQGLANLEHQIPIKPQTVFPLSSVTKPITAAAVLTFVEKGQISLERPIRAYLPALPDQFGDILVQHLLQQSSGLPDPYAFYESEGQRTYGITNQEIRAFMETRAELNFPPGARFQYSNANYVLLAQLLEELTGQLYPTVLEDLFFRPLGLEHTFVYHQRQVIPNRAYGYRYDSGEWFTEDIRWLSYGDGGIHSTVGDLASWVQALMADQILSRDLKEFAFAEPDYPEKADFQYGCGWGIQSRSYGKVLSHLGGDPGFGSSLTLLPSERIGAIILANFQDAWQEFTELSDTIIRNVLKDG